MSRLTKFEARVASKAMYDALRSAAFIGHHHGFEDYADRINDIANEIQNEARAESTAEIDRRIPAK